MVDNLPFLMNFIEDKENVQDHKDIGVYSESRDILVNDLALGTPMIILNPNIINLKTITRVQRENED